MRTYDTDTHLLFRQIMLELEPILTNKEKGPEKSAEVRAKEFDKAVAPVRAYTGDVALLAAPDRFIKDVVLCVPGFFARLKVLELLYLLPDALALCHRRLDIIQSATVEIKTSPRLATLLLDVVLPLGNTLNTHARKAVVSENEVAPALGLHRPSHHARAGRRISHVLPQ